MASVLTKELALDINGKPLMVQFHRVPRRRHVHLLVDDDAVVHVRSPYRFSADDACKVVCGHQAWVLGQLDAALRRRAARPVLEQGCWLPFLDHKLRLDVNPAKQLGVFDNTETRQALEQKVTRVGDTLRLQIGQVTGATLRGVLELWYREQARIHLGERVHRFARLLGVTPSRTTIRGQKTCWGSCSSHGNLSLNWRLMQVGAALVDYVVIHELCHLEHMNHSPAFWRRVASLVPDYRAKRQQLKHLQSTLPL